MITLKNSDMKQELKSVSDNSIDCLVTDPPYLIVQGGCTKPLGGMLGNKLHPTEKPIELLKHLILNSTKENEIVLDPFVGCGSTAIACALTGRQFIGYEIDKKYYDVAMSEIEKVTAITNPILV